MQAPSRVSFDDDFLGDQIDDRYSIVAGNGGTASIAAAFASGAALLACAGSKLGVARMRFGEDGGGGPVDDRNWLATKSLDYGARVFLNTTNLVQATVGFVGHNDPTNVLAAIFSSADNPRWVFQACNKPTATDTQQFENVDTGFSHVPGGWIAFEIQATASSAILKINGTQVAAISNPAAIPTTPLCAEFQLWNAADGNGAYSSPSMWIDWWGAAMDRT